MFKTRSALKRGVFGCLKDLFCSDMPTCKKGFTSSWQYSMPHACADFKHLKTIEPKKTFDLYNMPIRKDVHKKKQNRTLWECAFFNVFKLANAELHIPVSAVHPSLAMHIPLFCLLQGYQKHEKTKTIENPCQIPEYCKNLEKPKKQKKNKKGEPMYIQNLEKPKKTKKTKRENLCISKTSKNQKKKQTKRAEPM